MNNPSEPILRPLGLLVKAAVIEIDDGSRLFDGLGALFIDDNQQVYIRLGDYAHLGLNKHDP